MRVHQSGHCYLDLVEKKENRIIAKSRATIWSYTYANVSQSFSTMTGSKLAPGMKILLNASINFHEIYGLSLNVHDVDPNFTIGERERRKQEVMARLEREGLFELNGKLPLPLVPQNIAVISSATAAGWEDFRHQLTSNTQQYMVNAQLFDATMQGNDAPESISRSIEEIAGSSKHFDLVAIIRGGGAQTDLDCFDDYALCKAIAQCSIPVITGIGHERDTTIADLVAHTRMKTPTAVAEFILNGMFNFESNLVRHFERVAHQADRLLRKNHEALDRMLHVLKLGIHKRLHAQDLIIAQLENSLNTAPQKLIQRHHEKLQFLGKMIQSHDPNTILQRGFSITRINGQPVGPEAPKKGDQVETTTKNHSFVSRIE